MNMMMNKVVEEGTGRRALLDGIASPARPAPPTPIATPGSSAIPATCVGGVWIGNDDYSSTNRMTGGSLPAMTWQRDHGLCAPGHRAAAAARRCAEPAPAPRPQVAAAVASAGDRPPRPTLLTQRGAETLVRVERMMDDASRTLLAAGGTVSELPADPSAPPVTDAFASAAGSALRARCAD